MDIYRDYTTFDVMYKQGCTIKNCGTFYPLTVRDYYKFAKRYNMYFTYDTRHLNRMYPDMKGKPLLQTLLLNVVQKCQPDDFGNQKDIEEAQEEVIKELCDALSILTKTKIEYIEDGVFSNRGMSLDNPVIVTDDNYAFVMKVVALSNLIYQPNYYEDPEYERIMNKARIAHNKNPIDFEEMVAYVKNLGKLSYEQIMDETVFQIKCDYYCLHQEKEYETAMLFKTVSDDKSLNVKLETPFIEQLYDKSDSNLLTTLGALGLDNGRE